MEQTVVKQGGIVVGALQGAAVGRLQMVLQDTVVLFPKHGCDQQLYLAQRDMYVRVAASSECDVPPRGSQCLVLSVSRCTVGMRRIREKRSSFERWRSADTEFKGWWWSLFSGMRRCVHQTQRPAGSSLILTSQKKFCPGFSCICV